MQISFFTLAIKILGIGGRAIYRCKGLEITFPAVYYTPTIPKISVAK
jgi:hypothetical protein